MMKRFAEAALADKSQSSNLQLHMCIGYLRLLAAQLAVVESNKAPAHEQSVSKLEEALVHLDEFGDVLAHFGYRTKHVLKMLEISKLFFLEVEKAVSTDVARIDTLQRKLERGARLLLKAQELITNQVYYIGVHQDSTVSELSLPVVRLLGATKVRLAQMDSTIGVIKNSLKIQGGEVGGEQENQIDKVVATWMEAVTKQIEAHAKMHKENMNRYEKSIAILYSGMNMLHPNVEEYARAQVELAKCKRLLAVNKKHIRGIWRQDAEHVEKLILDDEKEALKKLAEEGANSRVPVSGATTVKEEAKDTLLNYKEEALRHFVEIITNQNLF